MVSFKEINPNLNQSSNKISKILTDSNHFTQSFNPDTISPINYSHHSQFGMFGDFCLMCGEMIDGTGLDTNSAYCSEECEFHQHVLSDSQWCNLSTEGYQLPSYGGSTTASSLETTPLNSPHLHPSDRLAILCSGPPSCESILPLDLNERLLGAKAVAERYLEDNQNLEEENEYDIENNHHIQFKLKHSSDCIDSMDPLLKLNSNLKSQPAMAQLTVNCLSEQFKKTDHLITIPTVPSIHSPLSLKTLNHRHPTTSSSKSTRRVSEPIFNQFNSSPISPNSLRRVCSSFSFDSTTTQSPISLNSPNDALKKIQKS